MYKRMRQLIILCGILSMVLAACQSEGVVTTPTVAIPTSPPSASMTPRAEASRTPAPVMPNPATTIVLHTPTPALPSADGGPVPPGAIARLGIGSIRASALSPDGTLLALGTTAGMYVYQIDTLKQVWSRMIQSPVVGLVWSPDGLSVAVWLDFSPIAVIYSGLAGTQQFYLEHSSSIDVAAWSPDGTRVVVGWGGGSITGHVTVWDVARVERLYTVEIPSDLCWSYYPGVDSVGWSPDGTTIAATGQQFTCTKSERIEMSNIVSIWRAETGVVLQNMQTEGMIGFRYLVFSPNGTKIAAYTGGEEAEAPTGSRWLYVWNVETGALLHELEHSNYVMDAGWSPDGRYFASVSAAGETFIWNMATGESICCLEGQSSGSWVSAVAWAPDGHSVISGTYSDDDGNTEIAVWNAQRGTLLNMLRQDGDVNNLLWLPDGRSFIAATADSITIWDVATASLVQSLGTGSRGWFDIDAIAWSYDGSMIGIRRYEVAQFYDTLSWQVRDELSGDAVPQWQTDKTPDSRTPSLLNVADVTYDTLIETSVSPDGRWLVIATNVEDDWQTGTQSQSFLGVWNNATTQLAYQLQGHPADIFDIAWSPDSKMLATGGGVNHPGNAPPLVDGWEENVIVVWDTTTWGLLHAFLGHTGRIFSLAWSPDGSMLASGSADGTVIVWNVSQ